MDWWIVSAVWLLAYCLGICFGAWLNRGAWDRGFDAGRGAQWRADQQAWLAERAMWNTERALLQDECRQVGGDLQREVKRNRALLRQIGHVPLQQLRTKLSRVNEQQAALEEIGVRP